MYFRSTPLLHRCIPTNEAVQEAYELLNSWSVAQQLFSDLYTTWPTVLMMCFVAFGLSPHSFSVTFHFQSFSNMSIKFINNL